MSASRFHAAALGIIVATGVLLYGHTLSFPFVFDDHVYLVDNPLVKDARSFVFNGDFVSFSTYSRRMGLDPDLSTNFILRPFAYLTFYINYALDGMRPRWFRAVNIAIHCSNAVLLFLILSRLLRASPKRGSLSSFSEGFIALGSALLFLAHPLQTESVTYVVQRFTSLGTFFYLLTILTWLLSNASESGTASRWFRCGSVAALVIGMLTKEFLFTAPFMIALLAWLVMDTPLKTACKRALPHFLCLPIIPSLIVLTAWAQHHGSASVSAALNITNPYGPDYQYHYALTQPSVILAYVRLILLPYGLNLDPDYPMCTSPLQPRFFMSALAILAILVGSWLWYRQRQRGVRRSLIFFSVLWFFLTVAPDSSVVPLPDLMAEHRSYLPSIGAFCALACVGDLLRTHFSHLRAAHHVIVAYAGAWIVALCAGTFFRHEVWRSEIAIWSDTVAKSPNKLRPLLNLGTAYYEHGKPVEAAACFHRVIQIAPSCAVAYLNLGKMMNAAGKFQDALAVLQAGLRHAPDDPDLHFELGVSQCGLGQIQEGEKSFKRAIQHRATHVRSHLNLGLIYAKSRQYEQALEYYRKADALRPLDPQSRQIVSQIETVLRQRKAGPVILSGP